MKKTLLLSLIFISFNLFAAKSENKKNESIENMDQEKIYQVNSDSAQLSFGTDTFEQKGAYEFWNIAISRSGINYQIPSLVKNTTDFTNKAVGVSLGKKQSNTYFSLPGFFEYGIEWQNFERSAMNSNGYSNVQKMNLFKFNFYQNYPVLNAFQKKLFVTFGAGVSPLLSMLEQSALADSATDLGILATIKTNLTYPLKNVLFFTYCAIDLELSASIGSLGGHNINATTIKMGTDINW